MAYFSFCLRNLWYLRTLAPAIAGLADRGHEVAISIIEGDIGGLDSGALESSQKHLAQLQIQYPGRIVLTAMPLSSDGWAVLDNVITRLLDFFHFRRGIHAGKPALVGRVKGPRPLRKYLNRPLVQSRGFARVAAPFLAAIERHLPSDPLAENFLKCQRADLVVFSPLIDLGFSQFCHLRVARRLGLRTALIVNSWDNLSSKAWLRESPDLITVWNAIQKDELHHFHRATGSRVEITGASHFDAVFGFKPAVGRGQFFSRLGLAEERPLLTYVASAPFAGKKTPEIDFAERWVDSVRESSSASLANVNIVIRPHPKRRNEWLDAERRFRGKATIWPPVAENPVDHGSVGDYLHTLMFSNAIIGLNTSAFLEGAILGRPVYTILDPEFAHSQSETFHFHYLGAEGKGLLRISSNLETHVEDLAKSLDRPYQTQAERYHLLSLVRPLGEDKSAVERLVDALETELTRPAPEIRPKNMLDRSVELLLRPLAAFTGRLYERDQRIRRPINRI